ncbi:MAG TPA: succinate dehydrogenase [Terriglobales bacterium]|nr:succinate dehydrogenase [Terriglobales bacterium]
MASTANPAPSTLITPGVTPLRSGPGYSFLLRRLHSLSGIVPVGLFLIEHFISNAFATRGPSAYAKQVELLSSFPFVLGLELFGIWLPILYHALYGFYIWYRGEGNLGNYPWTGNWMYTSQRWTGAVAFFYMLWHTWHLRFTGVHLLVHPDAAFGKVQGEFQNPWAVGFYALGILCASWHFSYGLWLFAAKWGIVTGDVARRRFGYVAVAIGLVFVVVGAATMVSFLTTPSELLGPAGSSYARGQ